MVEVTAHTLQRKDFELRPDGILIYSTDYAHITEYSYARIGPETSIKGACTDRVASANVVVLHSPTTRRTTVSHMANFMHLSTFIPLIDWVTGGSGKEDLSPEEIYMFRSGYDPRPCQLEAVVLRGFLFAEPDASQYGHPDWIADFRRIFESIAFARNIDLNIVDSERLIMSGAVLVDKITGKITHLDLPPEIPVRLFRLENPRFVRQHTSAQEDQTLFLGSLLSLRRRPEPLNMKLQFDVNRYCLPHPLSDEARELIRSRRLGEPFAAQSAIIKRYGLMEDWLSPPWDTRPKYRLLKIQLASTSHTRPCELCPAEGTKTCSGCSGAWYCGSVHQAIHWSKHKLWCRQHAHQRTEP